MHIINTRDLAIHKGKHKKKSRGENLWLQFAQILDCLCKVNKVFVNWDFWMTKVSMFYIDTCEFACGFEETRVPLKVKITLRQGEFVIWEIEVCLFWFHDELEIFESKCPQSPLAISFTHMTKTHWIMKF